MTHTCTDGREVGNRILLVEDNIIISSMLVRILQSRGYQVHLCADGCSGWNYLLSNLNDIHLIITDLDMPIFSGYELIELMNHRSIDIPVIVFSGNIVPHFFSARGFKVFALVNKPCGPKVLLDQVERAFSVRALSNLLSLEYST